MAKVSVLEPAGYNCAAGGCLGRIRVGRQYGSPVAGLPELDIVMFIQRHSCESLAG
jgi:hypothetical protein